MPRFVLLQFELIGIDLSVIYYTWCDTNNDNNNNDNNNDNHNDNNKNNDNDNDNT